MMTRTWQRISRLSINEGDRGGRTRLLQLIEELTAVIEATPGVNGDEAMRLLDEIHAIVVRDPSMGGHEGI